MDSLSFELMMTCLVFTVGLKFETNGQILTVAGELKTNVDLQCTCTCKLPLESIINVQWTKSRYRDTFTNDPKTLVLWSKSGKTSNLPGFTLKEDFSGMIVSNVNLTNEGWFRCSVIYERADGNPEQCTGDVNKLSIYANPDTPPMIKYKRHTNGLNVTCSVDNVFPMKYPDFISTTTGKNASLYSENADGTFNTAVTSMFSLNYTTIQCAYSALRVKVISSLEIAKSDINEPDEKSNEGVMTNATNMTVDHQRLSCRKMTGAILGMELICLIILISRIVIDNRRQKDKTGTMISEKKNKCRMYLRKLRSFCLSNCFLIVFTTVILIIAISSVIIIP